MDKFPTTPAEWAEVTDKMTSAFKDAMPTMTQNASGYEIRTQVLGMAANHVSSDFNFRIGKLQATATYSPDPATMLIEVNYPNADKVLEIAEKFMEFVNTKYPKTPKS
jgi:hypothetical protein